MSEKHWKVEVTQFGAMGPVYEGTVEAPTWLAALHVGRAKMGETGGLPAGASCSVAPNGIVTVQDARQRRRYRLAPATPSQIDALAPRPRISSVPPPPPAEALKRRSGPPKPSSPPTATVESKLVLLSSRDEKPTASAPLHFRERLYGAPMPMHSGTAEKLATKLVKQARRELEDQAGEKFVRVELFDHLWRQTPERPGVVRVEWKSWQKNIDIDFPLQEQGQAEGAARASMPSPPTEDRLAIAFEACQDLLFLRTRAEGLEFAIRLLEDLVPSDAAAACLFDINTDEFRVVAASGAGVASRQGRAVPSTQGLFGAAATLAGRSLLALADAPRDGRYAEDVDSVPCLDARAMVYRPLMHGGRLHGMLQLANSHGRGLFSEADCEVIDYVAEQLSAFVARGHSSRPPAPAG